MTGLGRAGFAVLLVALGSVTGGAIAQSKMPQGQFVCQVEDAGAVLRFIGVQADTLADAQNIVLGKSKKSVPAERKLIECISPPTQQFSTEASRQAYIQDAR